MQVPRSPRGPILIDRVMCVVIMLLMGVAGWSGCRSHDEFRFRDCPEHYESIATQIEYPDACIEHRPEVLEALPPHTVQDSSKKEYWPLTLEEAIRITLANSEVIRDLGGRIVSAPATVSSIYDPAISETDPRAGPEAALAAFDAMFSTSLFWSHKERFFNNFLFGGGTRRFEQDRADFQAEITKTAATGTQFTMRNITTNDLNNARFNLFRSSYETVFEAEFRQPLFQGAGTAFNRIAGPMAKPGVYNGVVLARINTDVRLADFELAVRDLLNDVERTYWELYLAYRDLDAKLAGREAALETWRSVHRRFQAGTASLEQEANARQQYYLFESQVINSLARTALAGKPAVGPTGVFAVERRLRQLMGISPNDGRIIRPADEPATTPVKFDWAESLDQSLWRRPELRRQQWMIKRRELELVAARNFLKMRVDIGGKYGLRGFGDHLFGNSDEPQGSAFADLLSDTKQEWQAGLAITTPIGNRIGHTAVRNAELLWMREKALYREQELEIVRQLSDAFAAVDRAYWVTRANFNAQVAAHQQLEEIRKMYEAGFSPQQGTSLLELLRHAQRRAVEADVAYYRSLVDHHLAIANVHYARGSLLESYGVYLSEGPWSEEAHLSAAKQARRFRPRRPFNYGLVCPRPVSMGATPPLIERTEPEADSGALLLPELHFDAPELPASFP